MTYRIALGKPLYALEISLSPKVFITHARASSSSKNIRSNPFLVHVIESLDSGGFLSVCHTRLGIEEVRL